MSESNIRKSQNIFKRTWLSFKNSENDYRIFTAWIVFALLLTTFVEYINRGVGWEVWNFIKTAPLVFLLNAALIGAFTLPIFFIKRRGVYYSVLGFIYFAFSFANKIIVNVRGIPLTFSDLYTFQEGLSLAGQYLSTGVFIAIAIFVVVFITLIICLWIKERKNKRFSGIIVTFLAVIISIVSLTAGRLAIANEVITIYPWNLLYSYEENGFGVSFINSYTAYKRKKPVDYNKKTMESLELDTSNELSNLKEKPNVIIVQLEAFYDVSKIDGAELSEDPIANFKKYSEKYTSGNTYVSTIGGATARSDFESNTGMSMDYFSPGEIPYNTVLKVQPIESIAYILKKYGYDTTAIHNYTGNFYGRNATLRNLGFDNYITKEYMTNFELSESGWPRDSILVENIKETLMMSDNPDYMYVMTVQNHGPYKKDIENKGITVSGNLLEEDRKEIEYYVNEQKEVDMFIDNLIKMVDSIGEPTVVAFYGDHLPALTIVNNEGERIPDKYATPYFIYDNIGLPKEDADIELFELSTKILDSINIKGGIIPQVHREYKDNEYYLDVLNLVQYDLLFGNKYIGDLGQLYSSTDMKMGIKPITITDATINPIEENNELVVSGENFTVFSSIYIGNTKYQTEFIDNNTLKCIVPSNVEINDITVKQIGQYDAVLSSTESFNLE